MCKGMIFMIFALLRAGSGLLSGMSTEMEHCFHSNQMVFSTIASDMWEDFNMGLSWNFGMVSRLIKLTAKFLPFLTFFLIF